MYNVCGNAVKGESRTRTAKSIGAGRAKWNKLETEGLEKTCGSFHRCFTYEANNLHHTNMWYTNIGVAELIALLWLSPAVLSLSLPYERPTKMKVIVTGAAGKTGKLVFSKLEKNPLFQPIGVVRSETSAKALLKEVKCDLDHIFISDVTKLDKQADIPEVLEGSKAMIICTSAVPQIDRLSIVMAFLRIPINLLSGKKAMNPRSLKFKWKAGQYPEQVDYLGQIAQIDLAKKIGVEHVVVVSSMGGTDPNNFLNSIGKKKDGSGNGDILLWKRKAERYLVESGLQYTIIHPGGLLDKEESMEQFVLDVDDKLIERKKRSICRADVANLCVAALTLGNKRSVSFDCITVEKSEGETVKSAEEALKDFLKENKTANYSL